MRFIPALLVALALATPSVACGHAKLHLFHARLFHGRHVTQAEQKKCACCDKCTHHHGCQCGCAACACNK